MGSVAYQAGKRGHLENQNNEGLEVKQASNDSCLRFDEIQKTNDLDVDQYQDIDQWKRSWNNDFQDDFDATNLINTYSNTYDLKRSTIFLANLLASLLTLTILQSGYIKGIGFDRVVIDFAMLVSGISLLISTISVSGFTYFKSPFDRLVNVYCVEVGVFFASVCSLIVGIVSCFSGQYGYGVYVLSSAAVANAIIWVRSYVIEAAPRDLKPIPDSFMRLAGLYRELLTSTEEERFFIKRSVQLTYFASLLCLVVMIARGDAILLAVATASMILFILPLPLVIELVPVLRALVVKALQGKGVFVESNEALDRLEGVNTLLVEIPDHYLRYFPGAVNGIWEFQRLDVFDGRFDKDRLESIIVSLCAGQSSKFASEVVRALTASKDRAFRNGENTGNESVCANIQQIDSTTIMGTVEGVPIFIGREAVFIQRGIFLSGHEVEVMNLVDEHNDTDGSRTVIPPHQTAIILIGVGQACVGRLVFRLRWDYRGLEANYALVKNNLLRTSVLSTGEQEELDRVCSALNIDLACVHGDMEDAAILQRITDDDPGKAIFVNPERLSSFMDNDRGNIKLVSLFEQNGGDEERRLENLSVVNQLRNVIRLTKPSNIAVSALFEVSRKALLLRQGLLFSSVIVALGLYGLMLFALCPIWLATGVFVIYLISVVGITFAFGARL